MGNIRVKTTAALIICSLLIIGQINLVAAAGERRVLVLPFRMNAPQEVTYLQQGIQDMLISRLEWPGRVSVISKAEAMSVFKKTGGQLNLPLAKEYGLGLGADYVLFGVVTVIGQNVSLDASLVDVQGLNPPLIVSNQSQGLDAIIPLVNDYAENINYRIFGRQTTKTSTLTGSSPQAPLSMAPQEVLPDYRRHPENLLTGHEGRQLSPLNPNFMVALGSEGRAGAFWRSPSIKHQLIGMDVADINGDGYNEIVYASRSDIYVARFENNSLRLLTKYKGNAGDRHVSLDLLDVNGNGLPEIFVSIQRDLLARSLVLEMHNDRLVPVAKDIPYYLRVAHLPYGPGLVGQLGGKEIFSGKVKIMGFSGGQYLPSGGLSLPKEANVFNFALAKLSEEQEQAVMINKHERLIIAATNGDQLWNSKDAFAGTSVFLEQSWAYEQDMKEDQLRRYWVPSRILITDLNEDGQKEILVAKNEKASLTSWFSRIRNFKSGAIHSLDFNQLSLRENWRSRPLPGGLVDYQIKDYNNDGRRDLVAAIVIKGGTGISEAKSIIAAYELATPEEMRQAEMQRRQ